MTIEFLCTLQITETGVVFRLFKKEYSIPWRNLSDLLGFPNTCVIDVDTAIQDFDKMKFWKEIPNEDIFYHPHTNEIHHPTLWFFHKWIGFTLFLRKDYHTVRINDLKLMYAAVKRKRVSPVHFMVAHWLEIPELKGEVGCTSMVTQIASGLGLLTNITITYIEEPR